MLGELAFADAICEQANVFIPCEDIQYHVLSLDSFGDAEDLPEPTFDELGDLEDQGFDPGGVNDVVMINVAYKYPIKTPLCRYF